MSNSHIDQDHYNALADWAESDDHDIHPERGQTGDAAAKTSRNIIRRAAGRPSVNPDANAGVQSPRRQVRLPRSLIDQVDQLATTDGRSPSDLMREAIGTYVDTRINPPETRPPTPRKADGCDNRTTSRRLYQIG